MLTLRQIPQAVHCQQALNNLDAFESATIDSSDGIFIAKYPGELGNSLKVSYCTTVDSDNGGVAHSITGLIKVSLTQASKTSDYVSKLGGKNDEIHVVVVDEDGEITGTAGEVLETFPFLSVASNAKSRRWNIELLERCT